MGETGERGEGECGRKSESWGEGEWERVRGVRESESGGE